MTQLFAEVEDPFLPQEPTKWPTILGWIMLIWGIIGIIFAIWGFASKSLAVETYQGLPDWMVAVFRMILICGTAVTTLGVFSGWYLRKKMRRGYSMAKWWVVLCLVLNVGGLAIQIVGRDEMQVLIKRTMLAQLEKQNQPAPELTPQMLKGIWFAQTGCAGLMGILPPLVIGVFLLGSKRRAEVSTWTH
jgi:hypothetical protein